MSCFDCRFYTGEDFLACGVDPITAANSPELGCRDWEPTQLAEQYWELLVNPPHVDDVQIGCVPINGWEQLVCHLEEILLFEDDYFKIEPIGLGLVGSRVIGNSIWRDRQGRVVGFVEAFKIEDRDWYLDPDPLSGSGQMLLWFNSLLDS